MSKEGNKTQAPQRSVEELEALVASQTEVIAKQEATIGELIGKIEQKDNQLQTGAVTIKHNNITYRVIGKNVPTLGLEKFNGAKSIPAEELEQHPELVELYIKKGHGFIVPAGE